MSKKHKWPKKDVLELKLDVWGHHIYITRSRKAYKKAAKYMGFDLFTNADKSRGWVQYYDDTGQILAYITKGDLRTLVHELSHITFILSERKGWYPTLNDINNEPFCYTLDYLFDASKDFTSK